MTTTKLLVKKILEASQDYEWSLQGLGMLRMYLSKEVRLHVWDPSKSVRLSTIHDHPWDFTSEIVAGKITNVIYQKLNSREHENTHWEQTIVCGPKGGAVPGGRKDVCLYEYTRYSIPGGGSYSQHHTEIHESLPEPGTVTLITRKFTSDEDHARVYFPLDQDWVSAEPRPAQPGEAYEICQMALKRWF